MNKVDYTFEIHCGKTVHRANEWFNDIDEMFDIVQVRLRRRCFKNKPVEVKVIPGKNHIYYKRKRYFESKKLTGV